MTLWPAARFASLVRPAAGSFTLVLILALLPSWVLADVERSQPLSTVEITGLAGIQFGGEVSGVDGQVNFDSDLSYGGMIGYRVSEEGLVVISYHRQRADASAVFNTPPGTASGQVDIGYLQFGGELELPLRPNIIPMIGLTVGATHFTPVSSTLGSAWYFSAVAYAGVKVPITRYFGLRSQMRMLGTVINGDGGFICGSGSGGGGCVVGASNVTGMIQGDFSAGVYFAF